MSYYRNLRKRFKIEHKKRMLVAKNKYIKMKNHLTSVYKEEIKDIEFLK